MNGELAQKAKLEADRHGGIYALSKAIEVNPGVIHRVINGGNSPTLRRLWKIPKHPPRHRLIIDCEPELRTAFDAMRRDGESRGACLERLMLLAQGIGEVVS